MEAIKDNRHPYRPLYEVLVEAIYRVNDELDKTPESQKRLGTPSKDDTDADRDLCDAFSGNHRDLVANLLIMYGVAMQAESGHLPEASTLVTGAREERSHWLALATQSRRAFFRETVFGQEYYKRALETGEFYLWSQGFEAYLNGQDNPFAKCTTESALVIQQTVSRYSSALDNSCPLRRPDTATVSKHGKQRGGCASVRSRQRRGKL